MEAVPFGRFEGREAIAGFWQQIIDRAFSVAYTQVTWQEKDQDSCVLRAGGR